MVAVPHPEPEGSTLVKLGQLRKQEAPPDNFAWNITAGANSGKASLVFNCAKPWEPDDPVQVGVLSVTVG